MIYVYTHIVCMYILYTTDTNVQTSINWVAFFIIWDTLLSEVLPGAPNAKLPSLDITSSNKVPQFQDIVKWCELYMYVNYVSPYTCKSNEVLQFCCNINIKISMDGLSRRPADILYHT